MSDQNRSLRTRWSMLDGLRGESAEESWRWFVDRYRPYILSCLRRLIRPGHRAEQAADEIWSYLFTSAVLDNADRERRFRSYLAGTVRNFALTWLRQNLTPTDATAAEPVADGADPAVTSEQQDMQQWTRQVVQLALAELARRHAEQVQVLRWFYGLPEAAAAESSEPRSVSWIAEQLGLKANAVHQIVFRGRKRLRTCIENELRETVRDEADLGDELRLIYAVIAQESPGLEG